MEPAQEGRLNKYAAHFLACHVRDLQTSCDKVYGDAEDSMCKQVDTSICLRSAGPDFSLADPNATTTANTGTAITSTTTTAGTTTARRFLSSTSVTTTANSSTTPSPKTCDASC